MLGKIIATSRDYTHRHPAEIDAFLPTVFVEVRNVILVDAGA